MSTEPSTEIAATLAKLAALIADQDHTRPEPEPSTPAKPERVLLTVEEAADQLNIGRTKTYALVRNGAIESVQIGRLRRVPKTALQDYAQRLIVQSNERAA